MTLPTNDSSNPSEDALVDDSLNDSAVSDTTQETANNHDHEAESSLPVERLLTPQEIEAFGLDIDISHFEEREMPETTPLGQSNANSPDTRILTPNELHQLAALKKETPEEQRLEVAYSCVVGHVRQRNEDSSFVCQCDTGGQSPMRPFGLYIVADGMGGHHDGHEASQKAARTVAHIILDQVYLPLLRDGTPPREPVPDIMTDAVQTANQAIFNPSPEKDSGTTLTAALIFGKRLYIGHVGDSRAYLFRNDKLQQLTDDHSFVQRLIDAGQLTPEEAAVHPQRNLLYRAVGQGGQIDVDTLTRPLTKTGYILICSDGLWGLMEDEDIAAILGNTNTSSQEKVDQLVTKALDGGGHDNITGILINFKF
ncbi:MAG TPA: PP2C family serine/threonine-protein phosphatase [Anaerolineae bacterium]|nr:PP2C family serine/threonine-protein phosphatase [Anaerolineae bacterium]